MCGQIHLRKSISWYIRNGRFTDKIWAETAIKDSIGVTLILLTYLFGVYLFPNYYLKAMATTNRRFLPELSISKLQFEFTDGYKMKHKAWRSIEEFALLLFNVIHRISRSHGATNRRFWLEIGRFRTVIPVWIKQWLWNDAQSLTYPGRDVLAMFFQGNPS